MKKYIPILVLFIIAATLGQMCSSCATNPVTGEQELMLMTESQEISLGAETHESILQSYGVYDDPELQRYLNGIGQDMATKSHRPHLKWTFTVLDTPVINAFAVPGGYIYVTRGLMAHLNSEAELAMVVGHEIGHVTARHGARTYSKQLLLMGGLVIGSLASEDFREYAGLVAGGLQLLFLKYSRDHERQADQLGVEYAYSMAYDPNEFDDFFLTLNRMEEASGEGSGLTLPGFLSTHPLTTDRIHDVSAMGQQIQVKNPPTTQLAVRTEDYMRQIDGIVVGDDPRQGYVAGNAFYHPEMNFQFQVPNGWELQNTPQMVQMASGDNKAVILFQLAKGSTPRDAFDHIVTSNDLSQRDTPGDVKVNGYPGYAGMCSLKTDDGTLGVEVLTVQKDGTVYSFIGLANSNDFSRYHQTFVDSFGSFNRVQDRSKMNVQPHRLQVQRINRDVRVSTFVKQVGLDGKDLNKFLVLNSLDVGNDLRRGSLVKTIK